MLFGAWEMNWVAFNHGHDVALPGSGLGPVPFLMYPNGETAAGRMDSLDPDSFRYRLTRASFRPDGHGPSDLFSRRHFLQSGLALAALPRRRAPPRTTRSSPPPARTGRPGPHPRRR